MTGETIRSVTVRDAFYLDDGRPSPTFLRDSAGWRFRVDERFVYAERGTTETYPIPLENIAGLSTPRAASTPSTQPPSAIRDQDGEQAAGHSVTKQLADQASTRARGRPGYRR